MRRPIRVVVPVAVLLIGTSTAFADPLDQSSAAQFVGDATSYLALAASKGPAERSAMHKLVTAVRAGCPGALPGELRTGNSSQQKTYEALFNEAWLKLEVAMYSPLKATAEGFISEIARLRWSDKSLARTVAVSDHDSRVLFDLKLPGLCADVKAAAATGFTRTSQATNSFLNTVKTHSDFGGEELPTVVALLGPMKPSLRGDEAAVGHLRKLDAHFQRALGKIFGPVLGMLLNALIAPSGA